ncbi:hypothetical protein [Mycobacterium sp. ACS1612]|uniref:hypothetical protein n=1 Tax=Mycobacterium sp. ACS1612 TaxID=1834117 RepID=UPI0012EAF2F7|nr:hypothetical protein [Mycobacterium sp. ACS1612]
MAEAAVAAVVHLDRLGTPAILDGGTCDRIRRLGYHQLAASVHRRSAKLAA